MFLLVARVSRCFSKVSMVLLIESIVLEIFSLLSYSIIFSGVTGDNILTACSLSDRLVDGVGSDTERGV